MKKFMIAACAATLAVAALSSCCGKGQCNEDGCDTAVAKALVDSITFAQGNYIGEAILSNLSAIEREVGGEINKEDLIRGVQLVLASKGNRATEIGMQFGVQMINEMRQLQQLGVEVDTHAFLTAFKQAFLQDSVDNERAQMAYGQYQVLVNKVQQEAQAREDARKAASPESLKNLADGDAFIAAAVAADPEIKATDSGLNYKIIEQGNGESLANAKRIRLIYTEKTIDGRVINQTPADGRIAYITSFTPGMGEGLRMLNAGSKAVFYVPGPIAYGVNGLEPRNVGINETIVYEVEVLSLEQ